MATVTLQEAQSRLSELIRSLKPGEELVITDQRATVARLHAEPTPRRQPRRPGTLRGTVLYMAPDFDAPLEDFEEYME